MRQLNSAQGARPGRGGGEGQRDDIGGEVFSRNPRQPICKMAPANGPSLRSVWFGYSYSQQKSVHKGDR